MKRLSLAFVLLTGLLTSDEVLCAYWEDYEGIATYFSRSAVIDIRTTDLRLASRPAGVWTGIPGFRLSNPTSLPQSPYIFSLTNWPGYAPESTSYWEPIVANWIGHRTLAPEYWRTIYVAGADLGNLSNPDATNEAYEVADRVGRHAVHPSPPPAHRTIISDATQLITYGDHGRSEILGFSMAKRRLSDGGPDTSFGNHGGALLVEGYSIVDAIADPQGNLYALTRVAGRENINLYRYPRCAGFQLWKFDSDGQPDPTFGEGTGMANYEYPESTEFSLDQSYVCAEADQLMWSRSGDLVVAGSVSADPITLFEQLFVLRVTTDGAPVRGFGTRGWSVSSFVPPRGDMQTVIEIEETSNNDLVVGVVWKQKYAIVDTINLYNEEAYLFGFDGNTGAPIRSFGFSGNGVRYLSEIYGGSFFDMTLRREMPELGVPAEPSRIAVLARCRDGEQCLVTLEENAQFSASVSLEDLVGPPGGFAHLSRPLPNSDQIDNAYHDESGTRHGVTFSPKSVHLHPLQNHWQVTGSFRYLTMLP